MKTPKSFICSVGLFIVVLLGNLPFSQAYAEHYLRAHSLDDTEEGRIFLPLIVNSQIPRRIAFRSDVNGVHLALINEDGTDLSFIVSSTGENRLLLSSDFPTWSPDGSRIAFSAKGPSEDNYHVYMINVDGTQLTQLSDGLASDFWPDWSPDGTSIAFSRSSNDPPSPYDIYLVNVESMEIEKVTENSSQDSYPDWSPNGEKIAYVSNGNIHSFTLDTTADQQLTFTGKERDPMWSPDGSKIAFVSNRDGNAEIYVMNCDGTEQTNVSNNDVDWGDYDMKPSWSPDSQTLVYESENMNFRRVFKVDSDGANRINLTFSQGCDIHPSWSPDGSKIVFSTSRDGHSYEIFVMNPDGSDQRRLTYSAWDDSNKYPVWQPRIP